MKRCKNWVVTIVALLMLVGEISVLPSNLQGSTSVVNAAIHHRRRKHQYRDKTKIYTGNYRIVGNKRSKIFHVMRGHNYRMNRENAIFFKSKAAARAAGYRESKR